MTSHDNVTDIVERPNNELGWGIGPAMLCQEAAQVIATLRKQLENAREALEPSAATKYCYSGEFKQNITLRDEDGEEYSYPVTIEWTTIKEIMAAINARALKGQPDNKPSGIPVDSPTSIQHDKSGYTP